MSYSKVNLPNIEIDLDVLRTEATCDQGPVFPNCEVWFVRSDTITAWHIWSLNTNKSQLNKVNRLWMVEPEEIDLYHYENRLLIVDLDQFDKYEFDEIFYDTYAFEGYVFTADSSWPVRVYVLAFETEQAAIVARLSLD